jgi:hypothetical protein
MRRTLSSINFYSFPSNTPTSLSDVSKCILSFEFYGFAYI